MTLREITADAWTSEVEQSPKPVLVVFSALWCGACRMLHPIVERLASRYADQVTVATVNTDAEPALARRYAIRALPTVCVFPAHSGGRESDRLIGVRDQAEYAQVLDGLLSRTNGLGAHSFISDAGGPVLS